MMINQSPETAAWTLLEAYIVIVFFGIILMFVLIPVALEVVRDIRKLLKKTLKTKRHV